MPGTMSRADLRADLLASLQDAKAPFTDPVAQDRLLNAAALDLGRVRPRVLRGQVVLAAFEWLYQAPVDMTGFKLATWGQGHGGLQPWEKGWPGQLPVARFDAGMLMLSPPPTPGQIALLGADYEFLYYARHLIEDDAATTTIKPEDRGLLLLRAQAEACRELALRGVTKPVSLGPSGVGSVASASNGTPAALHQAFMAEFERAGR